MGMVPLGISNAPIYPKPCHSAYFGMGWRSYAMSESRSERRISFCKSGAFTCRRMGPMLYNSYPANLPGFSTSCR